MHGQVRGREEDLGWEADTWEDAAFFSHVEEQQDM